MQGVLGQGKGDTWQCFGHVRAMNSLPRKTTGEELKFIRVL